MTLALLVATLAACREDRACTLIGGSPPGVGMTGGVNGASVRICAGLGCGTTTMVDGRGFVNLPSLRPDHEVELRVTYSHGSQSSTSVVRLVPDRFQPNGPGCDPTVAGATLTLAADGRATG